MEKYDLGNYKFRIYKGVFFFQSTRLDLTSFNSKKWIELYDLNINRKYDVTIKKDGGKYKFTYWAANSGFTTRDEVKRYLFNLKYNKKLEALL